MAGGVEAVRVGEMRVLKAQVAHLGVHAIDEAGHVAGNVARDGDGGVVAGGQEQAVKEIAHRQAHPRLQAHDGPVAGEEVVDVDVDDLIRVAGLDSDERGHDLRDAGRRQASMRVLIEEELAALIVDDGGGERRDRRWLRLALERKRSASSAEASR